MMDRGLSTGTANESDGLRARTAPPQSNAANSGALATAGELDSKDKAGKDLKTFGRTPDGTGRWLISLGAQSWSLVHCASGVPGGLHPPMRFPPGSDSRNH